MHMVKRRNRISESNLFYFIFFLFRSWKLFGRKLFGPCVNFGNFMAGNFLAGNFLAGNFLSYVVIFWKLYGRKLFGRKLFGRIPSFNVNNKKISTSNGLHPKKKNRLCCIDRSFFEIFHPNKPRFSMYAL